MAALIIRINMKRIQIFNKLILKFRLDACSLWFTHIIPYRGGSKCLQCKPEKWIKAAVCWEIHAWWGEKLGRSQQPLEMFRFGVSEWVNIIGAPAWRARRRCLLSLLCPGLLAGAHSQWLPEIGPIWRSSLQFCFISYVWHAK